MRCLMLRYAMPPPTMISPLLMSRARHFAAFERFATPPLTALRCRHERYIATRYAIARYLRYWRRRVCHALRAAACRLRHVDY